MPSPLSFDPNAILIFADGASSGNPGPGGWGVIIVTPEGRVYEMGGGSPDTTNNRMELAAVIRALDRLGEMSIGEAPGALKGTGSGGARHRTDASDLPIEVFTDSVYVIRGITQWIWGWRKKGWKTADGGDVLNVDLWKALADAIQDKKITWKYVRGHSKIPGNERVDEIAVSYSKGRRPDLYSGPLNRYSIPIHDLPDSFELPEMRSKDAGPKPAAIGYLSLLNGKVERHTTWKECEARVKGRSGAKFKKAMNEAEIQAILAEWGVKL